MWKCVGENRHVPLVPTCETFFDAAANEGVDQQRAFVRAPNGIEQANDVWMATQPLGNRSLLYGPQAFPLIEELDGDGLPANGVLIDSTKGTSTDGGLEGVTTCKQTYPTTRVVCPPPPKKKRRNLNCGQCLWNNIDKL